MSFCCVNTWMILPSYVEEQDTEFQILANFKHTPCGNTRMIFSGDLQCLCLEDTVIKTKRWKIFKFSKPNMHPHSLELSLEFIKTKSWNNLIFKTCILHSFISRSRVFIESRTWKFQIKIYPKVLLFASLSNNFLLLWRETKVPCPTSPSISPQMTNKQTKH